MLGRGGDTHVILRGATDVAALALNALPAVGLHGCHHHGRELEARRMPCGGTGGLSEKGSWKGGRGGVTRLTAIAIGKPRATWGLRLGAGCDSPCPWVRST